jgi:subtilisin-like proprotein convertase family protein
MLVMVLIEHILINNGGEMVTIIQGNITLPHQILSALRLTLIPPDLLLMNFSEVSETTFALLLSRER